MTKGRKEQGQIRAARGLSRRRFLVGMGGLTLGLPYLEALAAPCLPGGACEPPQRFVLFHHQQGTVLDHWYPSGTETNFTLPTILSPVTPHQEQCLFIGGLDNVAAQLMSAGNGHSTANCSLYTGGGFADEAVGGNELMAAGPSIDQVIAQRIQGAAAVQSMNLSVGGGSSGVFQVRNPFCWRGANDPVMASNNPYDVYLKLFASGGEDVEAAQLLLSRRISVLDSVLEQFKHLKTQVSGADQLTLDAHAEKIFELENQLIGLDAAKDACGGASAPNDPEGYNFWAHDWEPTSADLQMNLMVYALSCGLTNTASIFFPTGHAPTFPWLWEEFGGPLVNTDLYDAWHGMVHTGRNIDGNGTAEPGLIRGYQWYSEMFALLLEKMKAVPDGPGQTLLDTSLVLWGSEFGDGNGHNKVDIPVVLAGRAGSLPMGRWLDYTEASGSGGHCVNEVYVALLQAFGGNDETFGHHMNAPTGALAGIL